MSLFWVQVIVILIGFAGAPAWAVRTVKNMNSSDLAIFRADPLYDEIRRLCHTPARVIDSKVYRSPVFKEIFHGSRKQVDRALSFDMQQFFGLWADGGGSRAFENLMKFPPYRLAVHDCFPNDRKAQRDFSERIVVADMLGRSAGLLGIIGKFGAITLVANALGHKFPRTMKTVGYVALVPFAYFILDHMRKQFFGLTKKEEQQVVDSIREQTRNRPKAFEQQFLQLYDLTITQLQNRLSHTSPDDPNYAVIAERIEALIARRPEILARIDSYDQPVQEPTPLTGDGTSSASPLSSNESTSGRDPASMTPAAS